MADVGGIPHIAFLEVDKSFFPQKTFLYVKSWDGKQWRLKGSGPLNVNPSAITTADSVSIASDGSNPYVAWTEYTSDAILQNLNPSQVHVAQWTGAQWVAIGGSLNVNSADWADDASIAYLNGRPYVAWTERTAAGNNQVYVKMFNGTNWVLVGNGTLNKDTNTGWAFRPSLVADIRPGVFTWDGSSSKISGSEPKRMFLNSSAEFGPRLVVRSTRIPRWAALNESA